ncbi:MAG: tetratricopeptide repeat protein [Rhodocyclaceae bacterium]|nr:tetratricopeptide repeat protein [Rhodocyclaceae bacterium]MBX3668894.1 tetratricopeptide repeat protein [Rhodocyclaceae bacterium]
MSVINRMLQDLDRRHALAAPAPSGLVALPRRDGRKVPMLVFLGVLGVGASAVLWQHRVGADARGEARATVFPPAATHTEPVAQQTAPGDGQHPARGPATSRPHAGIGNAPADRQAHSSDRPGDAAAQVAASPPALRDTSGRMGVDAGSAAGAKARPAAGVTAAPVVAAKAGAADPAPAAVVPRHLLESAEPMRPSSRLAGAATGTGASSAVAPEKPKLPDIQPAEAARPSGRISKTPRLPADPAERIDLIYREARAALQAGRVRAAADGLASVLAEQPRHAEARETLARLLVDERRLDEAKEVLRAGLALDPGAASLAHWLARITQAEGQPGAALAVLDALPPAALRADDQALRGGLLERLKRPQEAADAYRAAVTARPGMAVWWLGLGLSLEAAGQPLAAREALQRAQLLGGLNAELSTYLDRKLRDLQVRAVP